MVLGSMAGERSDSFIPPQVSDELPKIFSTLYDPSTAGLSYAELLVKCQAKMEELCKVPEE